MGKYTSIREFMETNYLHFNSATVIDAAKAYAKKQGLTVVVGAQDDEIFEVEGPSDPNRMIVNIMEGEVVFVWTE